LNYAYSDYEPLVDAETMRLHHSGHYKAYTDNLNAALREAAVYVPEVADMSLSEVVSSIEARNETQSNMHMLPVNVSMAIVNNGGGYLNHVLFFNQLCELYGRHLRISNFCVMHAQAPAS
jgi:Fe-Mn family superoxide dismutase